MTLAYLSDKYAVTYLWEDFVMVYSY